MTTVLLRFYATQTRVASSRGKSVDYWVRFLSLLLLDLPCSGTNSSLYHLLQLMRTNPNTGIKTSHCSFLENGPFLARSGCSSHKFTALFQEAAQTLLRSLSSFRGRTCLPHQHVNMMASNWSQIAQRITWPAFAVVCGLSACWVSKNI